MTASALRPPRSKWMRWRSPLPFLLGPGTAWVQLGSHSGMRLASERSSNTSSMGTPTKPEYVREIGRMGVQSRCAVLGARYAVAKGVRGARLPPRHRGLVGGLPATGSNRARRTAHVVPLASRGTVARFEGLLTGGADSKFRSRAGL